MPDNQTVVPIGLIRAVFTSEFPPQLFGGADTHEPTLRLVGQLVRHTQDDDLIEAVIKGALPEAYPGDTLAELPRMIADARKKGFDKTAPKRAEFEMTESGLVFFKLTGKSVIVINVSDPFEILGLVRDAKSASWARLLRWRDADNQEHEFIASNKQLLSDDDVVCGDMAEQGLRISKGQQGNLARYILASKTDVRVTLVNRIGWHKIGERGLRFSRQAPAPRVGTIEGDGPGTDFGRLRPGAHLGVTPGSTGFGSPAPSTQPAVVFAPRDPCPSYLAPVAGTVAAPWLPSCFQVGAFRRSSEPIR